jgi:hypothetical protein
VTRIRSNPKKAPQAAAKLKARRFFRACPGNVIEIHRQAGKILIDAAAAN